MQEIKGQSQLQELVRTEAEKHLSGIFPPLPRVLCDSGWAGLAYTVPSRIFISTVLSGEERLVLYLTVRSAGGEQDVARLVNLYQTISLYKHH